MPPEPGTVGDALARFRARPDTEGWCRLPFFQNGTADRIARDLDREIAAGIVLAPAPDRIFRALALTPLDAVKVVILGQDPYPRAGDATGLAFSYGGDRAVPASLRVILQELAADQGHPKPRGGDLTAWAQSGVLLLNTALTTRVGVAGAHLRTGWQALADQAVSALSAGTRPVAFLLWGASARARAVLIDRTRYLVIESGHPSPLNRARDFQGSRPFGRANAWLARQGIAPIDWRPDRPPNEPPSAF